MNSNHVHPPRSWKKSPITAAVLGALLGWVVLQLWRPAFFLTDDNISGYMPVLVAAMRRLWLGQSPFVEPNLYGGDYFLLRDISAISLWNPLHLLISPLAFTRYYYTVMDLQVLGALLVCAGSMSALLLHWRATEQLALSNRRLVFLTLSYTFSMYVLLVGSCWAPFIGNVAALPLIILGLWQASWRRGMLLVTLGLVYGILCGHLHPWVWTVFFVSFFVLGACWVRRGPQPLLVWGSALLLSLLILSPLLYLAIIGINDTPRTSQISLAMASVARVVPQVLFPAFVLGAFGAIPAILAGAPETSFSPSTVHSFGLSSCFAGGCLLHCWGARRRLTRLEWLVVMCILVTALFIQRPLWLAEILHQTPVLQSLRWPFREVFFCLFFLHLFIALRPVGLPPRWVYCTAILGATCWFVTLVTDGPPSFKHMKVDRRLIMSGRADEFWSAIKPQMGPTNIFVPVVPKEFVRNQASDLPDSLVGAFNYPALWGVTSVSGYTIKGFHKDKFGNNSRHHAGAFTVPEREVWLKERPINALTLLPGQPLRVELRGPNGVHVYPVEP